MQPMGRKKIKIPNAKHHPREKGKHITGWWENIVNLCKKRERQESQNEIQHEVEEYLNEKF